MLSIFAQMLILKSIYYSFFQAVTENLQAVTEMLQTVTEMLQTVTEMLQAVTNLQSVNGSQNVSSK